MNNATKERVEEFLKDFKAKAAVFGITYKDDRGKNFNALSILDITPKSRDEFLLSLIIDDYSQGPLNEDWHGAKAMWVFGKTIKNIEVYIKICIVEQTGGTICVSFHEAAHPMNYPLK